MGFEEAASTGKVGETSKGSVRVCAIKCLSCLVHVCTVRYNSRSASTLRTDPSAVHFVMEDAIKACRQGVHWDVFYVDDLVLTTETSEEVLEPFNRWKNAIGIVDRVRGVRKALRTRLTTVWSFLREISSIYGNKRIPLKNRSHISQLEIAQCLCMVLSRGTSLSNWRNPFVVL